MKAYCIDGTTIDCAGFKAVDGGVVLFEDDERETQTGFVPYDALRLVLPDDVEPVGFGRGTGTEARREPGPEPVPGEVGPPPQAPSRGAPPQGGQGGRIDRGGQFGPGSRFDRGAQPPGASSPHPGSDEGGSEPPDQSHQSRYSRRMREGSPYDPTAGR